MALDTLKHLALAAGVASAVPGCGAANEKEPIVIDGSISRALVVSFREEARCVADGAGDSILGIRAFSNSGTPFTDLYSLAEEPGERNRDNGVDVYSYGYGFSGGFELHLLPKNPECEVEVAYLEGLDREEFEVSFSDDSARDFPKPGVFPGDENFEFPEIRGEFYDFEPQEDGIAVEVPNQAAVVVFYDIQLPVPG